MTSILPITAGPARVETASSQSASPQQDFSQWLDDKADKAQVFAFAELGMFGRNGAVSAVASATEHRLPEVAQVTPADRTPDALARGYSRVGVEARPLATPAVVEKAVSGERNDAGDREVDVPNKPPPFIAARPIAQADNLRISEPGRQPDGTSAEPGEPFFLSPESPIPGSDVPLMQQLDPSIEDLSIESPNRSGGKLVAPSTTDGKQADVNVVVSSTEGELNLSVRSADPMEPVRLQRAVQEVASEFGLDVSELRLNGASIEIVPNLKGSTHDRRAR